MTTNAACTIWIDATGILLWGRARPTGIQRVEASIVAHALAADDIAIGVCAWSRFSGNWQRLDAGDLRYLRELLAYLFGNEPSHQPVGVKLRQAWMLLKYLDRNGLRSMCSEIAGHRSGLRYELLKLGFRLAGFVPLAAGRLSTSLKKLTGKAVCILESPNNTVFMSFAGFDKHAHGAKPQAIAARLIHICHDLITVRYPDGEPARTVSRFTDYLHRILGHHAHVFCPSHATLSDLAKWANEHSKHILTASVCPLGNLTNPEIQAVPITALAEEKFVIYCATIEPRKNHERLVLAWELLAERHGVKSIPTLVFAGKWGWRYDGVRRSIKRARRLGVPIAVINDLSDGELRWLYENALFSLYPSRAEGWGLAVSEALSRGLPALLSDAPSLSEAAGSTMPVIDSDDPQAWADAASELITDQAKLQALRARVEASAVRTGTDIAGDIFAKLKQVSEA